jgi:hypothetical protein
VATRAQEIAVGRIIACFAPGRGASPAALTRLAKEMQAELVGLFIEDIDLLRLAALPFAAEIGIASAQRRVLDPAALERALRAQAARLRQALAAALEPDIAWSFRVARASPVEAVAAALAEIYVPALLIPPGGHLRTPHGVVRRRDLDDRMLRELLAAARPMLVLPE